MHEIGEKVVMRAETVGKILPGTVVYVHPRKFFYTVQFISHMGNKFCESFPIVKQQRPVGLPEYREAYRNKYS